ncbi:MAG: hypothetical protein GY811_30125 [Myxococcales bacterium]|nr:hypothetical protein [Myxococcales bacterium]
MQKSLGGLLGFTVVAASAGSAYAGGFASARFGGEHGNPVTDNATAVYYNPAGLALGSGTRLFVEGLLIYRAAEYERPQGAINNIGDGEAGTPTEAVGGNSGTSSVSNILASPFVGVASDLGVKNLGVGFAIFAPFGGQASWDKNNDYKDNTIYPGAYDGVQRWATMDGSIKAVYASGAAAYRLPAQGLSFGASVSAVSQSVNTIRARTALGNDDLVAGDGNLSEGRSHVDVSGLSVAAGLGIVWDASESLRFGVSYQSQPGFGETTLEGDLNFKFGNSQSDTTAIAFTQSLPDVTRFGVSFQANEKLQLRLSGDYTRWSVMTNQCLMDAADSGADCSLNANGGAIDETQSVIVNIERNWEDTFGVRAGASYWLNSKTELAGGLAYDSTAVPDETMDPAFIDTNKVIGVFGGRFRLAESMLLNVSYTHVYYITREVDPRERDAMGNEIGFSAPSATPDQAGKYTQNIGLINLGMEYEF